MSQPDSQKSILPKKINIRPRGIDEDDPDAAPADALPRIRPTGHFTPPEAIPSEKSRRRRRRKTSSEEVPGEFPHHLPGEKRRSARRNFLIAIGISAGVIFVATAYFIASFFYHSGLSEGMQRGLDARSNVSEAAPSERSTDNVMALLLNLRDSSLDRPTTEMLSFLVLQALSETPQANLPTFLKHGHTTVEDFAAAYVAMRLGDFGKAAGILRATEPGIPPDLFRYLMNDPAMRAFGNEPRVMGFY